MAQSVHGYLAVYKYFCPLGVYHILYPDLLLSMVTLPKLSQHQKATVSMRIME